MIQVTEKTRNVSGGIQTTISHSIKAENMGIIANILRKQLYSDPQLACIREVAANAFDAHVMVGKRDLPSRLRSPLSLTLSSRFGSLAPA